MAQSSFEKAQRAAKRKAHFQNGGNPSTWLGRPTRFLDRKRQKNKDGSKKENWDQE